MEEDGMLTWLRHRRHRRRALACSFCERSASQVVNLIAGARAYICDECVDKCGAIIAEQRAGGTA
jgi:ATP-dependent Clp protease ATP-binding subunit ClpX